MHRVFWLMALGACRIGFDEIGPDAGDVPLGGSREEWTVLCPVGVPCDEVAPDGSDFTVTCAAGTTCSVDCTRATECNVDCGATSKCDVACAVDNCSVSRCLEPDCMVACAGAPPTRYTSFASCP